MKRKRFISLLLALVVSLPIFLSPLEVRAGGVNFKVKDEDSLREKEREKKQKIKDKRKEFNLEKTEEIKKREGKKQIEKETRTKNLNLERDSIGKRKEEKLKKYKPNNTLVLEHDGTLEVKEDSPIDTIQKAIDIAYNDSTVETIKVASGEYREDLTVIRTDRHNKGLKLIGEGTKLIGSIDIIKDVGDSSTDSSNNFELMNFDIVSKGIGDDIGIMCYSIDLLLKNINIENHSNSIILDNDTNHYNNLSGDNLKIKNVTGPFKANNYNIKLRDLSYEKNLDSIYISNSIDDRELPDIYINNLEYIENKVESGTLIKGNNINLKIEDMKMDKNISDKIIEVYNDSEKNSEIDISKIFLKGNKYQGIKEGTLFKFENVDLSLSNVELEDNLHGMMSVEDSIVELNNLKYTNNIDYINLGLYISNKEKSRVNISDVIINSNKPIDLFTNDLSNVDLFMSNVNIDYPSVIYFENIIDGKFDLNQINIHGRGKFVFFETNMSESKEKHENTIRDLNFKADNMKRASNNYFYAEFSDNNYRLENIDIAFPVHNSYEENEIVFINSKVTLENIELKNIENLVFFGLEGSMDDYLINDLLIINDRDNLDIDNIKEEVIYIDSKLAELDISLKNIKVMGGYYYNILSIFDINNINLYQLYFKDIDILEVLALIDTENINIVNSTFKDIGRIDNFKSLFTVDSNINIYNTIFDIELNEVFGENSKLTFKNSVLPSKYEDIEGIEKVELFIDDTNLIGQALLDKEGVPIKDKSEDGDKLVVVDKGNNDYIKGIDKDLAGKERISENIVDIGAFEYQYEIPEPEKPGIPVEPEKPINPESKPEEEGINEAYIEGFEDGTVRAKAGLTKIQAAVVFYRLIDDKIIEENYSEDTPFTDIRDNYWGRKYIGTLVNLGIINGRPDGTFRPNEEIKRGELAKMIHVFEGIKKGEAKKFNDIKGHWAEEYIKSASEKGWLMGDDKGNFRPEDNISRIELIIIANRVFDRINKTENMIFEGINRFKDVKGNEWYYKDLVEATNSYKYKIKDGEKIWTELIK